MEYRRTTLLDDVVPSADETRDDDLPVNPLSHLIITIKVLNNAAKATLSDILSALEMIEVLREGSAIVSISGADLYALDCVLFGHEPWQENVVDTDNAVRALSLILPFGRVLYDPNECLPATRRGELSLRQTVDIADTNYDGYIYQVETVELLDATPKQHLKYTTINYTPSATGEGDVDLPIGLDYAGILLWGTTVPTGTSWTTTIDKLTFLVDNVEKYVRSVNWESLHGSFINRLAPAGAWGEKIHVENLAAAYTQNADTAPEQQVDTDLVNYAYVDFDPLHDDSYLFKSAGVSDLALRIDAGDTNATRIVPVQLKAVG